jgi:hypothetical protein
MEGIERRKERRKEEEREEGKSKRMVEYLL